MSPSVFINIVHESEKYQEIPNNSNFRCAFSQTDTNVCLFINIIATFIFNNSLILFSHKNLPSYLYILFSLVPQKVFLLSKNTSI